MLVTGVRLSSGVPIASMTGNLINESACNRSTALTWAKALRVSQWTKNGAVLLAWFFALADASQAAKARGVVPALIAFGMTAAFCLISSSFYLLNDVADCESDRLHPVKRLRPIAAGLISEIAAVRAALVLFAVGVAFPAAVLFVHPDRTIAFGTVLAYTILQCLYSGFLKHVPYVDVVVIAAGFVLRAVAGAAVIDARISPWLLVCAFSLSLFLALAKRRHEKVLAEDSRKALSGYRLRVIDALLACSALLTLAVYVGYTVSADTVARFHTRGLAFTAAFVALGLARYAFLVYKHGDVGRPEKVLLTDRLLWVVLFGYCATALVVVLAR